MSKADVIELDRNRLIVQLKQGELIELIQSEGRELSAARSTEYVVGNMVLRVLKLVREERIRLYSGMDEVPSDPYDSLQTLWESQDASPLSIDRNKLKHAMIETLGEYIQELECGLENITIQAPEHVDDRDTVLTHSHSTTVEQFALCAARKKRFRILVVQGSPENKGDVLCERLREETKKSDKKDAPKFSGIESVTDAAVCAVMPQVNKVILGAHCVLADGGFIGAAGTYALCLAAKRYSVPVIVCAAFYKLTPKFLSADDQEQFNEVRSPLALLPSDCGADLMSKVNVYNTAFDYVPPELVSLYIMQTFATAPSYVYRLLGEYFHPDDIGCV